MRLLASPKLTLGGGLAPLQLALLGVSQSDTHSTRPQQPDVSLEAFQVLSAHRQALPTFRSTYTPLGEPIRKLGTDADQGSRKEDSSPQCKPQRRTWVHSHDRNQIRPGTSVRVRHVFSKALMRLALQVLGAPPGSLQMMGDELGSEVARGFLGGLRDGLVALLSAQGAYVDNPQSLKQESFRQRNEDVVRGASSDRWHPRGSSSQALGQRGQVAGHEVASGVRMCYQNATESSRNEQKSFDIGYEGNGTLGSQSQRGQELPAGVPRHGCHPKLHSSLDVEAAQQMISHSLVGARGGRSWLQPSGSEGSTTDTASDRSVTADEIANQCEAELLSAELSCGFADGYSCRAPAKAQAVRHSAASAASRMETGVEHQFSHHVPVPDPSHKLSQAWLYLAGNLVQALEVHLNPAHQQDTPGPEATMFPTDEPTSSTFCQQATIKVVASCPVHVSGAVGKQVVGIALMEGEESRPSMRAQRICQSKQSDASFVASLSKTPAAGHPSGDCLVNNLTSQGNVQCRPDGRSAELGAPSSPGASLLQGLHVGVNIRGDWEPGPRGACSDKQVCLPELGDYSSSIGKETGATYQANHSTAGVSQGLPFAKRVHAASCSGDESGQWEQYQEGWKVGVRGAGCGLDSGLVFWSAIEHGVQAAVVLLQADSIVANA